MNWAPWEPWIHLAHVAGAIVWLGGGITLSIIGLRARRGGNLAVLADFGRILPYVGLRLLTPAVLVVLLSGLTLVLISSEWTLTQAWVLLALTGFVIAFLIGAIYLSRSAIQLERAANVASDLPSAQAALGRWLTGYAVVLLVLAFVVWDMIFKPGLS